MHALLIHFLPLLPKVGASQSHSPHHLHPPPYIVLPHHFSHLTCLSLYVYTIYHYISHHIIIIIILYIIIIIIIVALVHINIYYYIASLSASCSSSISGISKVHFSCSKIDMESERPNTTIETYKELQEEEEEDDDEEEEKNNEILKRRISSHPLYGLLVEAHLDCLKVGDISNLERELKIDQMQATEKQNLGMFSQSELDLFMEAYCMALGKLKEAMVEPQQKSMAFINNMHSQLREITKPTFPAPPSSEPAPPTASSSSDCKFRTN